MGRRSYAALAVQLFLFLTAAAAAGVLALGAGELVDRAWGDGYQDSPPGVYLFVASLYAAVSALLAVLALFCFAALAAEGGAGRVPAWAFATALLVPVSALPFPSMLGSWAIALNVMLLFAIAVALARVAASVRRRSDVAARDLRPVSG